MANKLKLSDDQYDTLKELARSRNIFLNGWLSQAPYIVLQSSKCYISGKTFDELKKAINLA